MDIEHPVLLPPDDLSLERSDRGEPVLVGNCLLLAHNVAPDGKANPIDFDDQHFLFLYQHGDRFFVVRGLNPEMMSGEQVSTRDAEELATKLPYRVN